MERPITDIIPKISKREILWARYFEGDELKYVLTSTLLRDVYMLYKYADGKLELLGKAKTPPELVEKYVDKPDKPDKPKRGGKK